MPRAATKRIPGFGVLQGGMEESRPHSDASRELTERDLVARARRGDRDAFGDLVRLHQKACLATARHLLGGDEDGASEAVQEALLRAWSRLGEFSGRGTYRAWLFAILRNLCRDRRRRWSREPVALGEGASRLEADGPRGEQVLQRGDRATAVRAALDCLTPRQRLALELASLDGCSSREIAEALGCARATARVTLYQARRKALRAMERHFEQQGIRKEDIRETLLGL